MRDNRKITKLMKGIADDLEEFNNNLRKDKHHGNSK